MPQTRDKVRHARSASQVDALNPSAPQHSREYILQHGTPPNTSRRSHHLSSSPSPASSSSSSAS
eukprot:3449602-Rhodomonas_salina.1